MLAFDLEVASWPESGDWDGKAPLGITCAAVAWELKGEVNTKTWGAKGVKMTPNEIDHMINELTLYNLMYGPFYTWNGAAFDFKVLAVELPKKAKQLAKFALEHYDGMLMITAKYGHFLGLDKAAKGAGVGGKMKSVTLNSGSILTEMSGAAAPELWVAGEREAVLAYLRQDVITSLGVGLFQQATNSTVWISKRRIERQIDFVLVKDLPEEPPDLPKWVQEPKSKSELVAWATSILS